MTKRTFSHSFFSFLRTTVNSSRLASPVYLWSVIRIRTKCVTAPGSVNLLQKMYLKCYTTHKGFTKAAVWRTRQSLGWSKYQTVIVFQIDIKRVFFFFFFNIKVFQLQFNVYCVKYLKHVIKHYQMTYVRVGAIIVSPPIFWETKADCVPPPCPLLAHETKLCEYKHETFL